MNFGKGYFKTFAQGLEREWVITNGIGGYAGNSIINANMRAHHSYLNASLTPPVNRFNVLAKIDEELIIGKTTYSLRSNQFINHHDNGFRYQQRFTFDNYPIYYYQAESVFVKKAIALEYGKNTVSVTYEIRNGEKEAKLVIIPFFNFRDHSSTIEKGQLHFSNENTRDTITLINTEHKEYPIKFYTSLGTITNNDSSYITNLMYDFDIKTGSTSLDNHYTPYKIEVQLKPKETTAFFIICTLEDSIRDGFEIIKEYDDRINKLIELAGYKEELASRLVKASDHFICHRQSTNKKTVLAGLPWFTDWGRDTMIALQGLTLVTKRFNDAREILESFSLYVKNGLVPNMFPDLGQPPLYNTVDASLWYFHSVDQYLKYTGDYQFVMEKIYPKLKEIINAYLNGTDFSIYMDEDYLIHAGSGIDQVTWMDVRVNGYVVTPRHGKPVEINALWYNALKFMAEITAHFNFDPSSYIKLSEKVKDSFLRKFWNEEEQCLFDVVDEFDPKIRPNQIYAVSLPRTMLPREKEKRVVQTVYEQLYNTYGLRSLSPLDPEFKPLYEGKLWDRDMAYHMGTTWGFLIGGFITAYCKVNDYEKSHVLEAKYMLELFVDHLNDGCINGIAEIFDGENPYRSRGCYSQAWSVGEVLRAYVEDVLNHLD